MTTPFPCLPEFIPSPSSGTGEDDNATSDLDIKSNITINGDGAGTTIIDTNELDRVLHVHSGDVTLSGLTIRDGKAPDGADGTVQNGGDGGGVYNEGTLTIADSTLSDNRAGNGGPGSSSTKAGSGGGVIHGGDSAILTNVTISGNTAKVGGGIYCIECKALTLAHCTVTGNTGYGGGIRHLYYGGTVQLKNTIVTANDHQGGDGSTDDCSGTITSAGYNLVGTGTGCPDNGTTDQTTTDPKLGPLQDNGGPTHTHALFDESSALDAIPNGTNGCGTDYTNDQRGKVCPAPSGGSCDVGAYEKQYPDLEASKTNDTGGAGFVGTAFNWTAAISNTGGLDATFTTGQTIFKDDLPAAGATHGAAAVQNDNTTGAGAVKCEITGTTLTCKAYGGDVTIGANTGKFDVVFDVTPNATGDLVNPDGTGVCRVDPDGHVAESDETNNDCIDTVTVAAAAAAGGDAAGGDKRTFNTNNTGGSYAFGPVKVTVRSGALAGESDCRLVITETSDGNFQLGERIYDIKIICASGHKTSFAPPLLVCIKPANAQLQAAGWSFSNLNMFHQHAGGPWNPLYNTYEKDGYLCAEIGQLSLFAIGVGQLPATGFTPGVVTALGDQPAEKAYFDLAGADVGRTYREVHPTSAHLDSNFTLEIPALDVEMPIVGIPLTGEGWDVYWLGESAGYLEGTAYPTWAGNTAITAHVWDADNNPGPFVDLHTLQHGDEIIIHAWGLTHIYEVRALTEFRPDNLSALPHDEYDVLTLITCMGYDESSGEYDLRLAVRAVLMDVETE